MGYIISSIDLEIPVRKSYILAGAAAIALSSPVLAQDVPEEEESLPDDVHSRGIGSDGTIIVTSTGLRQLDILAGTSVLEAVEIQRNLEGQIGDVLVKLPGVSATSFSPGASRPVLRGFQGERVKVLVDGLSTSDVSNTSVDHATTIDPLTAERIEVLRGPAVLLYGSQAIGGAVNVVDKRIPRRIPEEPFHIDALAAWNTAYDLRQGGASLDVPVGNLVMHVDGSYRRTNDYEIGGFQLSDGLRQSLLSEAAEEEAEGATEEAAELREAADQRGIVPNSATETWTVNTGFGLIIDDSTFGASVGWYNTDYGVPTRPALGHHGEEEGGAEEDGEEELVTIGLEQFRADFLGDIDIGDGLFRRLRLRLGYSDYTHTEFEGDEIGTTFDVQSMEARAELALPERGAWRGAIGAQYFFRDFVAEGAEAYVPPNLTDQFSLFALQEFGRGPIQLELGARYEMTDVRSNQLGITRDFDTVSGAAALIYEADPAIRFGINLSRAERAPSAEELFSNGPHIATQAFEIGDANLASESAWGGEVFARGKIGLIEFNAAIYRQWFDDFIYLSETGEEEDDLPVFTYLQQDADWFGIEGEVRAPVLDTRSLTVFADARASYTRAELDDGTNVPRIPPLELLGALEVQTDAIDVRGEVQWFAKQDKLAPFETQTDSFTLVNAYVTWHPMPRRENFSVIIGAENIFDVVGRRHASFTKDFVPLSGRNIRASVRLSL